VTLPVTLPEQLYQTNLNLTVLVQPHPRLSGLKALAR